MCLSMLRVCFLASARGAALLLLLRCACAYEAAYSGYEPLDCVACAANITVLRLG